MSSNNRLSSILFVLIVVGYPVSAGMTAILGVETNFLSMVYRGSVLITALLLIVKSSYGERLRIGCGIILGAAFVFYYAARMLLEGMLSPQSSNIDWRDFWLFFWVVCFFPALPFIWRRNLPGDLYARRGIIVFGIIGLVAGFYSVYGVNNFSIGEQLLFGRLEFERLNPIAYGHLGASVLIVSLWGLLIKKERSPLALIGALAGGLGVLASGSRGPFLSLVICAVLMCMFIRGRLIWFFILFSAACIMLSFLGREADGADSIYLVGRVASSMFEDSARMQIFEDAYHAFVENSIFGVAYPFDTYPHNIVVEAFMSSGIVGGLLMVGVLSVGGVSSIRLLKTREFSWVSLLFIQYLAFVMVSSSIYYSNIFWMLWVCVVVLASKRHVVDASRGDYFRENASFGSSTSVNDRAKIAG